MDEQEKIVEFPEKKENFLDKYWMQILFGASIIFVYKLGVKSGYQKAMKEVNDICDTFLNTFDEIAKF